MQLFLKAVMVFFVTIVIVIALALIGDVVRDRQDYRARAIQDIAANVGNAQTFAGPVLVLPYVETRVVTETDQNGKSVLKQIRTDKRQYVFPTRLTVSGSLPTGERARGMHKVRVYEWKGHATAQFNTQLAADDASVQRTFSKPWLSYELSDPQGLQGVPSLTINGVSTVVRPGAGFRSGNGIHITMAAPKPGDHLTFDAALTIALRGTQSFSVLPLGDDNRIDLSSDWNAPKFVGASPEQDRVAKGFAAHWRVSALSVNAQDPFVLGKSVSQRPDLPDSSNIETDVPGRISVVFIDPVDAYASTARAVKYGLLFLAVTFAGFFLFEFMKRAPIHPIQYLLVGLAMAIFFLLLLSFGEHVTFGLSYLVAAIACVGLISWYLAGVLGSWKAAFGFSALLAALYGVLYGVLISEDNALIMGSALLFVLLAAIMILTRKVDWYAVSKPSSGWKGLFGSQSETRK